jgi:hypothetical protein
LFFKKLEVELVLSCFWGEEDGIASDLCSGGIWERAFGEKGEEVGGYNGFEEGWARGGGGVDVCHNGLVNDLINS